MWYFWILKRTLHGVCLYAFFRNSTTLTTHWHTLWCDRSSWIQRSVPTLSTSLTLSAQSTGGFVGRRLCLTTPWLRALEPPCPLVSWLLQYVSSIWNRFHYHIFHAGNSVQHPETCQSRFFCLGFCKCFAMQCMIYLLIKEGIDMCGTRVSVRNFFPCLLLLL